MDPRMRTTYDQYCMLLDFMERHGDLNRCQTGVQSRQRADQLWQVVTKQLNCAAGGRIRTPLQWKKVWTDWKTKTKKKAIDVRRQSQASGVNSSQFFTGLQGRLLRLMGNSAAGGNSAAEGHSAAEGNSAAESIGAAEELADVDESGSNEQGPPLPTYVVKIERSNSPSDSPAASPDPSPMQDPILLHPRIRSDSDPQPRSCPIRPQPHSPPLPRYTVPLQTSSPGLPRYTVPRRRLPQTLPSHTRVYTLPSHSSDPHTRINSRMRQRRPTPYERASLRLDLMRERNETRRLQLFGECVQVLKRFSDLAQTWVAHNLSRDV